MQPASSQRATSMSAQTSMAVSRRLAASARFDRGADCSLSKLASAPCRIRSAELDSCFLHYLLLIRPSTTHRREATAGATASPSMCTRRGTWQSRFPLPVAAEQQRIVGILDEAFEGIAAAKANAEKNLQNARALFESHLQSVFSQTRRRMGGEALRRRRERFRPSDHGHRSAGEVTRSGRR